MERVFIAFSFDATGREAATLVESVLESHDIAPQTGEVLEGQPLTAAVKLLIREVDGLVGILTARQSAGGTSAWVRDELTLARAFEKPTIALVETSLQTAGAFAENERVDYDPVRPLDAIVKLNATVGAWKRSVGRRVKVRILPRELEQAIGRQASAARCTYRLTRERDGAELCDWRDAPIRLEPGGAFAFLQSVRSDAVIELQIQLNGARWSSRATPQWLHAELSQEP